MLAAVSHILCLSSLFSAWFSLCLICSYITSLSIALGATDIFFSPCPLFPSPTPAYLPPPLLSFAFFPFACSVYTISPRCMTGCMTGCTWYHRPVEVHSVILELWSNCLVMDFPECIAIVMECMTVFSNKIASYIPKGCEFWGRF